MNPTNSDCWEWPTRFIDTNYARIHWDGEDQRGHRLFYEKFIGPIPEGMFVCHRCDNPPCVNPSHMFLGTAKENLCDASRKGRLPGRRHWTHCPQGHEFTNANTYWFKERRQCKTCTLARQKAKYAKRKGVKKVGQENH
jgi:hypothetical protein